MTKPRYSSSELDARLKFILGTILGLILLCTAVGILYALIFVTQPINAQSENDKMFFNVLGSIATFITGTLAGILIGNKGGGDTPAQAEADPSAGFVMPAPVAPMPTEDFYSAEEISTGKSEGEMPEELPIEEDWDKD
jgi:hypothetical protein